TRRKSWDRLDARDLISILYLQFDGELIELINILLDSVSRCVAKMKPMCQEHFFVHESDLGASLPGFLHYACNLVSCDGLYMI
ncbi:hypothetical protein KI387_038615, partial [Taxus chinensis]